MNEMRKELTARGWTWATTESSTPWKAYKCLDCGYVSTYPSNLDLNRCKICGSDMILGLGNVKKMKQVHGA
jgi:DNA-directed RNA polymerase subunit RPC12/RpoP